MRCTTVFWAIRLARLIGTDSNAKMSKNLGNAIPLDISAGEFAFRIRKAQSDPERVYKNDPGHPDICPVYAYHRTFLPDESQGIREGCERVKLGCSDCKARMTSALEQLLEPMRERRSLYAAKPQLIDEILMGGTCSVRMRTIAKENMHEIHEAMRLDYFR